MGVGRLTYNAAITTGATGPVARSAGLFLDVRHCGSIYYGIYNTTTVVTYMGMHGDSFDRFIIRVRELFEASRIIHSALSELSGVCSIYTLTLNSSRSTRVENLINLFASASENTLTRSLITRGTVESGKGEFSIVTVLAGGGRPYRVHIRSPAYTHLQLMPTLLVGHHLADVATLLGTLDIVFGEVDR